jgi:hypothetical protein
MSRRRVTIATGEVTSEQDGVIALVRAAPANQRGMVNDRRPEPAMGDDFPVVRTYAARERRVVAIAWTDGVMR